MIHQQSLKQGTQNTVNMELEKSLEEHERTLEAQEAAQERQLQLQEDEEERTLE